MSRVILSPQHPLSAGLTGDSRLVRAYRGERSDTTPVWFMRQAGRSLPEYRDLRVGTRMLDACLDPAMASEITLQPVRRHRVDAGIFFSDIVVPLKLVGRRRRDPAGPRPRLRTRVRGCRGRRRADRRRPRAPRRGIRAHHRGGAAHDRRAEHDRQRLGHRHPAHRVRRRPVHPRGLPRRGRPLEGPPRRPHPHARRPGCVARAHGVDGRAHRPVPAHAGARRGIRGAALRLVGRARSRSPTTRPTWRPRRRRRSRTCTTSRTRRRMPRARP